MFPSFHPPIYLSRHRKHCFRTQILSHLISLLLLSRLCFLTCLCQRSDSYPVFLSCFFFYLYPNRSVALICSPLLLPFTFSPFFGYGCRLQQASCTDRLSRGLLQNTAQKQKCKQVERAFVELHSFPCHHTPTLNIPLSSACVVCCGGFCGGQNFPEAPYCARTFLLTISRALQYASHCFFGVFGILWADGGLLWIHVTLFLAPSLHRASEFTLTHTYTLLFRLLFAGGQVSPIWPHTVECHKTFTIFIIYRLTQYKYPTKSPTERVSTVETRDPFFIIIIIFVTQDILRSPCAL